MIPLLESSSRKTCCRLVGARGRMERIQKGRESSRRLGSCGEEVRGSLGGPCFCPPMPPGSGDPGDTPLPTQSSTHAHMASPSFLPWLVQDSKFISTPEGETQRGYMLPPWIPCTGCRLGTPTYHLEVPERNQIVTVRNTTELSKADKISPVNCETEVTVLFVLRE